MVVAAGSRVLAIDTPPHAWDADSVDELADATSTYYQGANVVGTTFIAPTSGAVCVFWGARAESNTASRAVMISIEVREGGSVGTGTIVSPTSDDSAIEGPQDASAGANSRIQCTRHRVVTGLTTGDTYNVRVMYKGIGSAGNVDIFARDVFVVPLIA